MQLYSTHFLCETDSVIQYIQHLSFMRLTSIFALFPAMISNKIYHFHLRNDELGFLMPCICNIERSGKVDRRSIYYSVMLAEGPELPPDTLRPMAPILLPKARCWTFGIDGTSLRPMSSISCHPESSILFRIQGLNKANFLLVFHVHPLPGCTPAGSMTSLWCGSLTFVYRTI